MNNQQLKPNNNKTSTKLRLKVPSNQDKNQQNNPNSTDDHHHHQNLGISNYLQGYDRELDSDQDEPIGFEEQFILKLPESLTNESNKLRELVESRKEINSEQQNIYFKFKDSRRGIFNIGDKMFGMKLVDLPCVIESQKTFDNKHMFKIADICQMILVEDTPITNESTVTQGNFNIQDFIYPHGLTPPLHHVRKRRFRKRLNKRTIETVERAVERLLEEDGRADQVIIDIVDNVRDLSDSEGEDYQPPQSATVGFGNQPPSKIVYNKPRPSISSHAKRSSSQPFDPHGQHQHQQQHQQQRHHHDQRSKEGRSHDHQHVDPDGSIQTITADTPMGESLGAPTPAGEEFEDRGTMNDDDEGSIDSDLAAEIEAGLMESAAAEERAAAGLTGPEDEEDENDSEDLFGDGDNDDEEEEEEDDEEEEEDDDEEETNEMLEDKQRIRLLQGELKDLEAAVNRKKIETAGASNLIVRKRFEEALKKLNLELESKKNQLNSTQLSLQNAILDRKKAKELASLEKKKAALDNQPNSNDQDQVIVSSHSSPHPPAQPSSSSNLNPSELDNLTLQIQLNDNPPQPEQQQEGGGQQQEQTEDLNPI
ncbi:hypothetical protein PGT21_009212 [Puccinia graminis f. sp. tritici]|uniref:TAFII55 protein conserved region domain-containing protein n=1 Tax=Puccinia graminis f. sp. tritici TaxID=56615 RepID=A0A5B0M2W0_PUCGR|nr:hypothetical protein PGTUg99_031370 [Puccinia graminis f. sp. tritici]KAA1071477.1 hypothetical protein PGT21_009212 [Puccinia graminis f. sp. tritici]